MPDKKILDAELQKIQTDAVDQVTKHQSARDLLYQNLAAAYIWWRQADKQEDYLNNLYAANGIAHQNRGNRPNFNPLVKLVFKLPAENNPTTSQWAGAILALHDYFDDNPQIFDHRPDPVGELTAHIRDSGGVNGLRRKQSDEIEGLEDDSAPAPKKGIKPKKPDKKRLKTEREVVSHKKSQIEVSAGILTVDVGTVAANDDNLLILLARRDKQTGKLVIVGTTNDNGVVNQAILECVEIDLSNTTPSLRVLIECLKPHCVPRVLHKRMVRDKFFTAHLVPADDDGNTSTRREMARLVITKQGTILVSKSLSDASLTTISHPNLKFGLEYDVYLRGNDRHWLEADLINEDQVSLYKSSPKKKLEKASAKTKASKQLVLTNELAKTDRNIYFYDMDSLAEDINYQPTVIGYDSFTFDWEINASKKFVDRFYKQALDPWLVHVKKNIHTKDNKCMTLVVADDHIEAQSHYQPKAPGADKVSGYTRYGEQYQTLANGDATIDRKPDAVTAITVSPLDIAELFATVASMHTGGNVVIRGNAHIMMVSYVTATAKHTAFVPACDHTGKRDATHFTRYAQNG